MHLARDQAEAAIHDLEEANSESPGAPRLFQLARAHLKAKDRPAAAKALQPGDLAACWQALTDNDAAKAFTALGDMVAAPAQAVVWIKDNVFFVGGSLKQSEILTIANQLR